MLPNFTPDQLALLASQLNLDPSSLFPPPRAAPPAGPLDDLGGLQAELESARARSKAEALLGPEPIPFFPARSLILALERQRAEDEARVAQRAKDGMIRRRTTYCGDEKVFSSAKVEDLKRSESHLYLYAVVTMKRRDGGSEGADQAHHLALFPLSSRLQSISEKCESGRSIEVATSSFESLPNPLTSSLSPSQPSIQPETRCRFPSTTLLFSLEDDPLPSPTSTPSYPLGPSSSSRNLGSRWL